jgi:hypothetical protein
MSVPRRTMTATTSGMWFDRRFDRVIIFICLLSLLLSVGFIGCATRNQPTISLEQWEREYNRVRSRDGD